jgi:hypothetical protein
LRTLTRVHTLQIRGDVLVALSTVGRGEQVVRYKLSHLYIDFYRRVGPHGVYGLCFLSRSDKTHGVRGSRTPVLQACVLRALNFVCVRAGHAHDFCLGAAQEREVLRCWRHGEQLDKRPERVACWARSHGVLTCADNLCQSRFRRSLSSSASRWKALQKVLEEKGSLHKLYDFLCKRDGPAAARAAAGAGAAGAGAADAAGADAADA